MTEKDKKIEIRKAAMPASLAGAAEYCCTESDERRLERLFVEHNGGVSVYLKILLDAEDFLYHQ